MNKTFEVNKSLIDAGFRYFDNGDQCYWYRGPYKVCGAGSFYTWYQWDAKIGSTNGFNDFQDFLNRIPEPENESTDKSPTTSPETIVNNSFLDYEQNYPEPPALLAINGTTAGTPGNIVTLTGQKKSRKTFSLILLVKYILNVIASECSATPRQVIWIDTEQAEHHTVKIADRLHHLTGIQKSQMKAFFSLFCFREYTPPERTQGVLKAVENTPENSYLIIDGIRDLLNDFNDPTESNELVTKLMRLSSEKNILIIAILHQNKGNAMARGHLGTELGNKSESLIQVNISTKNDQISIIEAEATRNPPFEPLPFFIDAKGLPRETEMPTVKPNSREITPSGIPDEVHLQMLNTAFASILEYSARQLFDAVANGITDLGTKIGPTKARSFVTYYEQKGWIHNINQTGTAKRYVLASKEEEITPDETKPF